MAPCQLCERPLPEQERESLWVGRYERVGQDVAYREEYAIVVCHACAEGLWPRLRDAIRAVPFRAPRDKEEC